MTTQRLTKKITWVFPIAALALVIALALMSTGRAHADQDPATCGTNSVGVDITVYESDQTTVITGADTLTHGQTIFYQAVLSPLTATHCAFEGGTWTLTTPDGSTALGAVPRVGGTGVTSHPSAFVQYIVDHAEETAMVILANTTYTGGFVHQSTSHPSGATAIIPADRSVEHPTSVATEIHDSGENVVTFTSVAPGTSVHDEATVSNVDGLIPTGNVEFDLYDGLGCSNFNQILAAVGLDGSGVAHPSSSSNVPVGGLSYIARYLGDGEFFLSSTGTCEEVDTVVTVQMTTEIHDANHTVIPFGTTVADGTVVHDKAIVTGNSGVATGDVTFTLYDDSTCTNALGVAGGGALSSGSVESSLVTIGTTTTGSNLSFSATFVGDGAYSGQTIPGVPACEHLVEKSVGGVTNFFAGGSDSSSGSIALLAGGAAAVLALVAVGGWYVRRRSTGTN